MERSHKVHDDEVSRALLDGVNYLLVGKRRFKVIEVTDVPDEPEGFYEVMDPDELRILERTRTGNPRYLRGEEAREYLKARLSEHGIR